MISVIIPTYNEEENLSALHERCKEVTSKISGHSFEFIFIDDCSNDKTPGILEDLRRKDKRIKLIRFSRNCGSHAAVAAGLEYCKGDAAIMFAADLQDPPELIPLLLQEWEKGYKVVWGVRAKRKGESFTTIALSRFYYFLMNRLTDIVQPSTGNDVFLIDRIVIDAFKKSPEKNTSVYMLISWLGYSQTAITYNKEARYAGVSTWTASKRLKLFFDSLISFSYAPLRFMSLMGAFFAILGLLYSIVVIINSFRGIPVGWASLMIVILLIGGFQMIMMGLIGEYLWRTYDEARGRPRYVIEKTALLNDSSDDDGMRSDKD